MNKKQKKWLMFSGWNIDWKCKWQTLLPLRLIQASNRDGTRNDNHLTQQQTCLYTRGESIGEGVASSLYTPYRPKYKRNFISCSFVSFSYVNNFNASRALFFVQNNEVRLSLVFKTNIFVAVWDSKFVRHFCHVAVCFFQVSKSFFLTFLSKRRFAWMLSL